ncbi:MAG: hypothetical protein Q9191_002384 [Dirinaria sp. TL-2023a]
MGWQEAPCPSCFPLSLKAPPQLGEIDSALPLTLLPATCPLILLSPSVLTWEEHCELDANLSKQYYHCLPHRFLASAPSILLLLASMESVPLLCKICPKQPHFSDISHLLTHVSSKGHLAHYFNAQVRSRENGQVRRQLEAYDEWYDGNQIESLLSQRMAQKDTKKPNGKYRATRASVLRPVAEEKATQDCEGPSNMQDAIFGSGHQDAIDPQLSLFLGAGDEDESMGTTFQDHDLPSFDLTSLHRTRAPRMQPRAPTATRVSSQPRRVHCCRRESPPIRPDAADNPELDQRSSPSYRQPPYPDPTALPNYYNRFSATTPSLDSPQSKACTPGRISSIEQSPVMSDTGSTHFLKLKGPQYPGMALFDSASPKSQRLRNQKKEHSLLAQMEYNAMMVEPVEQIYFPEWTLKKARPITGNVESSPIPEITPKPKRRRGKASKAVLGELSTNMSTKNMRETSKSSMPGPRANGTSNDDFPLKDTAALRANDSGQGLRARSAVIDEDALEWKLNMGLPRPTSSNGFDIFSDTSSVAPPQLHGMAESHLWSFDDPFVQSDFAPTTTNDASNTAAYHLQEHLSHALGGLPSNDEQGTSIAQQKPERCDNAGFSALRPSALDSKENMQPLLNAMGHTDSEVNDIAPGRITQRYFSVRGYEPPRFFSQLPPEMGFGGFADHRFWSTPYNPLNAKPQAENPVSHSMQPNQICPSRNEASNNGPPAQSNNKIPAHKDDTRCPASNKRIRSQK